MTSARVDFASVDHAFDLAVTGYSRDTVAWAAGYLGEKANTGLEVHRKLDKNWDEMWVELVAKGDGFVQMNLQGEWYSAECPDDIRYVWVDDVSVEGSSIVNGGFEDAGPDGKPAGWSGNATGKYYSRDGSIAHGGKCCVAISIGTTSCRRSSRSRRAARIASTPSSAWPTPRMPERIAVNEYNVQFYSQQVKVTFTSEQAAKKASLRIAPLFEGCLWSMGSRWDDNNGGDLLMRDCLARHGHHGTYYLNGLYRDWPDATPTCNSAFVKDLLRTGDSIGAAQPDPPVSVLLQSQPDLRGGAGRPDPAGGRRRPAGELPTCFRSATSSTRRTAWPCRPTFIACWSGPGSSTPPTRPTSTTLRATSPSAPSSPATVPTSTRRSSRPWAIPTTRLPTRA